MMEDFLINVSDIEEWQTIGDRNSLDKLFKKAKVHAIGGGTIVLSRKNNDGSTYVFDKLTTEAELEDYRKKVYKYL
jgi:hypothetical protein